MPRSKVILLMALWFRHLYLKLWFGSFVL